MPPEFSPPRQEQHNVRHIAALQFPRVDIAAPRGETPKFKWIDPAELLVDESYQRNLSSRSLMLIRRILAGWDWTRFKPPVVANTDLGLEIIDGQHTAIAAASHPGIELIPVMLVGAPGRCSRAAAFIGHNRERLGITNMQLHFAALTAGDVSARTIDEVCRAAGVRILKAPPAGGEYQPGDTVAVAAIGKLISRRGDGHARKVLETLRKADSAPLAASAIKAVEYLYHDEEFEGRLGPDEIVAVITKLGDRLEQEARVFTATHSLEYWKALARMIFKHSQKMGGRNSLARLQA